MNSQERSSRYAEWMQWCIAVVLLLSALSLRAQITAEVGVSSREVYVGQPFLFRIQISGSDQPEPPDMSAWEDFEVSAPRGQRNSSERIISVNGRVQRDVQLGYVLDYTLTPTKEGQLTIPSLTVRAGGQTARTQPLTILTRKPEETDTIKVRMDLSKEQAYVGEPLTLTVTCYLARQIQAIENFGVTLSALGESTFSVGDPLIPQATSQQDSRALLNNTPVYAEQATGSLDGSEYVTVTLRKVIIPGQAGSFDIEPALLSCRVLTGYQRPQRPLSPFDSFFSQSRGVYESVVVPSNPLKLTVRALPTEGRPGGFAGPVGEYRLEASASPTSVKVGDPITLTIALSGSDYLEHVALPPLQNQTALANDFRIPNELTSGQYVGLKKVYTHTIRALRADVQAIPPIELPYFDTGEGRYRVARSDAIPLNVEATRLVTAADAEGLDPSAPAVALQAWTEGIAHNYSGEDLLADQRYGPRAWMRSPVWLGFITAPPMAYVLLLATTLAMRRRNADPVRLRARKAHREFQRRITRARQQSPEEATPELLDALREYLARKLGLSAAALTFKDVQEPLTARGVDDDLLNRLKEIFRECEASRYAGASGSGDSTTLVDRCAAAGRELEKLLT